MNDTTPEVGSAIGIAVMGSVYGSHYRDALPASPAGLPPEAAAAVKESAAAGLEVADHAGAMGSAITTAVEEAFMTGLSASLLVVAAVLVAAVTVLLRAPRRSGSRCEPSPGDTQRADGQEQLATPAMTG